MTEPRTRPRGRAMRHSRWQGGRFARVLATALVLAGAITTFGLARALAAPAGCQNWTGAQPPNPGGVSNTLDSVAISSACDVWAVGQTGPSAPSGSAKAITRNGTLILHWDGSHWTRVPSPDPGISAELFAVASSSAGNVWAVGESNDGQKNHTLAVHCC
jgi:hypothetical protein